MRPALPRWTLFTAHLLGVPVRQTDRSSLPLSVEGPGSDTAQDETEGGLPDLGTTPASPSGAGRGPDTGTVGFETETLTLSETAIRSRIQASDYVDLMATATLALTEWTLVGVGDAHRRTRTAPCCGPCAPG